MDARDAVRASDAMILAAFGPCKRLGDALDVLETTRGRDAATERVLALLRRGALRELHTYVLRCRRGAASRFRSGRDGGARQAGAGRAVGPPSFIARRLPGAVALLRRPRPLLEMMWRRLLSQAERMRRCGRSRIWLADTVQREVCVPLYKSVVIFGKSPQNPFCGTNCGRTSRIESIWHPARYALRRRTQTSGRSKRSKAHSAALRSVGKARGLLA